MMESACRKGAKQQLNYADDDSYLVHIGSLCPLSLSSVELEASVLRDQRAKPLHSEPVVSSKEIWRFSEF